MARQFFLSALRVLRVSIVSAISVSFVIRGLG